MESIPTKHSCTICARVGQSFAAAAQLTNCFKTTSLVVSGKVLAGTQIPGCGQREGKCTKHFSVTAGVNLHSDGQQRQPFYDSLILCAALSHDRKQWTAVDCVY